MTAFVVPPGIESRCIGNFQSIGQMLDGLKDDNAGVKSAALSSLRKLSGQPIGADFDAWSEWWDLNED